jgi:DegV family protein with EDD domain
LELIDNYVNLDGRTVKDRQVVLEELMRLLRSGRPIKTAQSSAAEVTAFLDRHLTACDRLFYIAVGNAYTGTQSLVRRMAAEHPLGHKLTVIDTKAASGQQGIVCLAAARAALDGHAPDAMLRYIESLVAQAREYLVIDNLKYLSRTGRVGKVMAAVAGMLSVHPIVGHGDDGAVTFAKVRSHEAAFEAIGDRMAREQRGRPLLVMVQHTDNLPWAEVVRSRLSERLGPGAEILLSPLSSTSAVHMGPGTWGVSSVPLPAPRG